MTQQFNDIKTRQIKKTKRLKTFGQAESVVYFDQLHAPKIL